MPFSLLISQISSKSVRRSNGRSSSLRAAGSCLHCPAGRRLAWLSTCGRRPVVTLTRKGDLSQAIFCILLSMVVGGKRRVPPGVGSAGLSYASLVVVLTPPRLRSDPVISV
jgi:hypothetical protein